MCERTDHGSLIAILAVMYGAAEVLKMATATNAELLATAGKTR
jgi:imidazolonepropionase-like amidohydrolase